jgi:hypothetical protein
MGFVEPGRCGGSNLISEQLQLLGLHAHDLAWPVASVHKAADQAKTLDLLNRVEAFTQSITHWIGKAIASLPYPQRVL